MAGFAMPTIAPLWSIGVEVQFYALWPVFLKYVRNIFLFLVIFLLAYIAVKIALLVTGNVWSSFSINFNYFSYDTLAIGGIAAWLYVKQHKTLKILYHPFLQIASWLFFVVSCIAGPFNFHYIINKEIYSIAFAIIILNVSTNPGTLIKLRGRIPDFVGRISYGMYVLHPFVIVLATIPLKYIVPGIPGKPLQFIFISAFVVPLTVLVAHLSFNYFESIFLRRKEGFSRIPSTNKALNPKEQEEYTNTEAVSF
jgi:peptidoglycan/LPS O-acetylase OafA/YrhL